MSPLAIAAFAAVSAAAAPVHTIDLDHRGKTYRVDYHAKIETRSRTIGIAPPTRPSSQRCIMTATVSVERVIADGNHALTESLPDAERFTRQLPGDCKGRESQLAKLVDDREQAIGAHVAQVASNDRTHVLAAIDAAHHFAAN